MNHEGIDWTALAIGAVIGVWLAAILAGLLQERSRRLWNAEMARETRLWEETAERAYERGVCDGARLANPVEPAGMVNR